MNLIEITKLVLENTQNIENEKQFQFWLAWELKTKNANVNIQFEKKIKKQTNGNNENKCWYIDLVIDEIYIELKLNNKNTGDHPADIRRYEFWKDVTRLEKLSKTNKYIIFACNDKKFWEPTNNKTIDANFLLFNGRKIKSGELSWSKKTNGEKCSSHFLEKHKKLNIKNEYVIEWTACNNEWKFLILKVV